MVRQLRRKGQSFGLVLANGGVLTYQHVVCLSSQPRKSGTSYPTQNPLPEVLTNVPVPPTESTAEGKAIIEVITILFLYAESSYVNNESLYTDIYGRVQ